MATLQHELQHVLDYRIGFLTAAAYLLNPRHWIYDWRLGDLSNWNELGAEQRASIAEHLWLAEHGYENDSIVTALKRIVPWV